MQTNPKGETGGAFFPKPPFFHGELLPASQVWMKSARRTLRLGLLHGLNCSSHTVRLGRPPMRETRRRFVVALAALCTFAAQALPLFAQRRRPMPDPPEPAETQNPAQSC